jgi:xylulokinase
VKEALLTIDVGTSRTRVKLFSPDGCDLAGASRPTMVESDAAGAAELDVERLWREVCELIKEVASPVATVRGIGIAAQLGMVLVDSAGEGVGRALLWADTRAREEAEELDRLVGELGRRVSGRRITPELLVPRLIWFRRHRPDLLARAEKVISVKDFLVLRLTGHLLTDETHASYSGLFDVDNRCWSDELIRVSGCDVKLLPRVLPATAQAGVVSAAASARTGIARGVHVAVGASDGTVGVIGAGAVRPAVTVDVAGTTDTLLHTTAAPLRDSEGAMIVNAHAAPGLWSAGGPTGLTGGAVAWMARVLGFATEEKASIALSDSLARVPPGSEGPFFRPALTGSRFPDWVSTERGMLAEIDFAHGPLHLLRAAQEGAAFTVANALDVIRRCGCIVEEVIVVGGLALNPLALQLRADALNVRVVTLANEEASSIGAAMMAGVCAGLFKDLCTAADVFVAYSRTVEPDCETARILANARARWNSLRSVAPSQTCGQV